MRRLRRVITTCCAPGFSDARGTVAGHVAIAFSSVDIDHIPLLEDVDLFVFHFSPEVHNIVQCYGAVLVDVMFAAFALRIQETMQIWFTDIRGPHILVVHVRSQDCHNVQPRPVLRDAVIACIQHPRVHTVRQSSQNVHDGCQNSGVFLEGQPPHVLDYNHSWSLVAHVIKAVKLSDSTVQQIIESSTFACRAECLTWSA